MKKLIAGSVILALALTGAPQAAAFSSGSSGSPAVTQPSPDPLPQPDPSPKPPIDLQDVLETLTAAYDMHHIKRGYTLDKASSELAQLYAHANDTDKVYLKYKALSIGFAIRVDSFPTHTYKEKYQELANIPFEPLKFKLAGKYIQPDRFMTTVTTVIEL